MYKASKTAVLQMNILTLPSTIHILTNNTTDNLHDMTSQYDIESTSELHTITHETHQNYKYLVKHFT